MLCNPWEIGCLLVVASICLAIVPTVESAASNRIGHNCSDTEYYESTLKACRTFPGGGFPTFVDNSSRCRHDAPRTFGGREYYYVCIPTVGIMIGHCPANTLFNDTEKQCIQTEETTDNDSSIVDYDECMQCRIVYPTGCSTAGVPPSSSNCSMYFNCRDRNYNFHQFIRQCPAGLLQQSKPQKGRSSVIHHENLFSDHYYPPCHTYGQFRTAKDCTLYYRCIPSKGRSFYQVRYQCPKSMTYDTEKEMCVANSSCACSYVPYKRIIEGYKLKHELVAVPLRPCPTKVITTSTPTIRKTTASVARSSIPSWDFTESEVKADDYLDEDIETQTTAQPTTNMKENRSTEASIFQTTTEYSSSSHPITSTTPQITASGMLQQQHRTAIEEATTLETPIGPQNIFECLQNDKGQLVCDGIKIYATGANISIPGYQASFNRRIDSPAVNVNNPYPRVMIQLWLEHPFSINFTAIAV